VLASSLGRQEL